MGPRAYARLQRALWSGAIIPHSAWNLAEAGVVRRRVCNNWFCIAGLRMHLLCCKLVLVPCDFRTSSAEQLCAQSFMHAWSPLNAPHSAATCHADTGFLAGLGVMDYSLLVGVDKARGELVLGVIDYCRQVCVPQA